MVEVLEAGNLVAQKLPRLSVIFSFRNEEANIPELLRRTRSVAQQETEHGTLSGYELIFVNDASTDGSLDLLSAQPTIRATFASSICRGPSGMIPACWLAWRRRAETLSSASMPISRIRRN